MGRIVFATIGSLGDLHPYLAIGRVLAERGHSVLLAVPEDQLASVRSAGLEGVATSPGQDRIAANLGVDLASAVAIAMEEPDHIVAHVLLQGLDEMVDRLAHACRGADLIVGSNFAFAASIVAESHGCRFINTLLQPMTMFSIYDPPRVPGFEIARKAPVGPLGLLWNRCAFALIRTVLRKRFAARLNAVRRKNGLAPVAGLPLLDRDQTALATLCCWSPHFAEIPPDLPRSFQATGFAIYDGPEGQDGALAAEISSFLDGGSPPLVFSLGSFAVHAPGQFYERACQLSKQLGRRAILLMDKPAGSVFDPDILPWGYAPHSLLFPRAHAIIHHGGAGTTAQALRSGRPQIIVPHMGDQYDNAARVVSLGAGITCTKQAFAGDQGAERIAAVINDAGMARRAAEIGLQIRQEDGAQYAANAIEQILDRTSARPGAK